MPTRNSAADHAICKAEQLRPTVEQSPHQPVQVGRSQLRSIGGKARFGHRYEVRDLGRRQPVLLGIADIWVSVSQRHKCEAADLANFALTTECAATARASMRAAQCDLQSVLRDLDDLAIADGVVQHLP